jgi:hypothetical protein
VKTPHKRRLTVGQRVKARGRWATIIQLVNEDRWEFGRTRRYGYLLVQYDDGHQALLPPGHVQPPDPPPPGQLTLDGDEGQGRYDPKTADIPY